MVLELMICPECGAEFGDDLFAVDPSETIVCPLCGTVALDAIPVEDRILHIHAFAPPAPPEQERLSA
jgi:Zn-finger nucleic acid-binding protein